MTYLKLNGRKLVPFACMEFEPDEDEEAPILDSDEILDTMASSEPTGEL